MAHDAPTPIEDHNPKEHTTMSTFRKKPVEIEAMQFTGHNYDRIASWMGDAATTMTSPGGTLDLHIETLEGTLHVSPDDWVIRGVQGEFYPCKPDIFEQTYDPVGQPDA